MRKVLLGIACIGSFLIGYSQSKDLSLTVDHPTVKLLLPAVTQAMSKESKYQVIYEPRRVTCLINNAERIAKDVYIRTDAKRVNKKDDTDYSFKIITPGISNVKMTGAVYLDSTGRTSSGNIPFPIRGYVLKYTFNFPIKVEVSDKTGVLLKTIIVSDENQVISDYYHRGFLNPKPFIGDFITTITPFSSPAEAAQSINNNPNPANIQAQIEKVLEQNAWYTSIEVISQVLSHSFGEYKNPVAFLFMLNMEKKDKSNNTALSAIIEGQRNALDNISDLKNNLNNLSELEKDLSFYEKLIAQQDLLWNTKKLALYNASLCALFTNKLTIAKKYFDQFKAMGTMQYGLQETFDKYYAIYSLREILSSKEDAIKLPHPLTVNFTF